MTSEPRPSTGPSAPVRNVADRDDRSSSDARSPLLARAFAYRTLLLIALSLLALDQLTKAWIVARLPFATYGEPGAIRVVRGFFYIVHVGNTGAAWSLFSGQSIFLAALAAATLIAIFIWRRALGLNDRIAQISFGLLCGGIAGNL